MTGAGAKVGAMAGAVALAFLSHWRRHPLQLATLVVGLALATGLWSAVQAINAEARASYRAAAQALGAEPAERLVAPEGAIPLARYVALRRAGWAVSPVLEGVQNRAGRRLRLQGIDLLTRPMPPALAQALPADAAPETLFGPTARGFADPDLAAHLAASGEPDLPPITAAPGLPPDLLVTDIAVAARLLARPDSLSHILILPEQLPGLAPLAQLAPDLIRQSTGGSGPGDLARLTDSFHLNLSAFGLLAFVVGLFVVHGMVGLAHEQRRASMRTLRALGVPARFLVLAALTELILLAALAGMAGLVLGHLVAQALMPGVAVTLRGLYGAPVDGGIALRPGWVLGGLGMALLGSLLASAQALWRVIRLPILAAPGPAAWFAAAARSQRRQAQLGLVLILAGLAWLAAGDGLIAGFAFLGGILMGAALILPWALARLLVLGAGLARGPVAGWVWADMRAQLPGLSLALMALLLALAANIGVSTMVGSFRLTFTGWLDQRLGSDLYVTARDDAQGAEIAAWAAARNATVLPIRSVDVTAAGQPVSLYGIVDHPSYRAHWPLLAAIARPWDRVAAGGAVMINEQLARRAGIGPGALLEILPGWLLEVAGVYSDYGNPTGQAMVALPALLDRVPDLPNRRFGLRLRSDPDAAAAAIAGPGSAPAPEQGPETGPETGPEQVAEWAAQLRARFDLAPGAVLDQAAMKARAHAVFERTFAVTGALNLLTLLVAGFTLLTALLTLWSLRLPQIAPVWALGLDRARLARLEIARSLALAALTAILALPLGLVLAWALLAVINVEAFGWRLPMHLFPGDWLRLGLLALAAAGLAAALPARRLYHCPPADLLKVFADAR